MRLVLLVFVLASSFISNSFCDLSLPSLVSSWPRRPHAIQHLQLASTASTTSKPVLPSRQCVDLVLALADTIGAHERCLAANASPAKYCIQCAQSLTHFKDAFQDLAEPSRVFSAQVLNKSCVDECAPVDDEGYTMTMIAMYYKTQILGKGSLYEKGACDKCFMPNGTILPHVHDTMVQTDKTMQCFDQFKVDDQYIRLNKSQCDVCSAEYFKLKGLAANHFYQFDSCSDAKQAIYVATKIWITDFQCSSRVSLPYHHIFVMPILIFIWIAFLIHPIILLKLGFPIDHPYKIVLEHHSYEGGLRHRHVEVNERIRAEQEMSQQEQHLD